jgi:hypothetical protein
MAVLVLGSGPLPVMGPALAAAARMDPEGGA